ncbi:MAG: UDP-N-acetylglucosamine 1-carboxyvinyltransferase [Bacilli bacterium]|nr:UDP-N-acetylglucosamine 1-carboxyvinyltransferase [Bacilli bacterium]
MKRISINGGNTLSGTINITGAKNSAVALIPASVLCDEQTTIYNVPNISDRDALIDILNCLNCETSVNNDLVKIDSSKCENKQISLELSKKMRASYYFMGALLSKFKHVEMYFPGGCNIGKRPIDIHIKGFEALGATVKIKGDLYTIDAENLKGTNITLDFASVGATINIMLAAVKAEGRTVIRNAAREAEIVNIATFLNNMGAKITGAGTSVIRIEGVDYLHRAMIEVIPDRIEAGTYIILGAMIGNELKINNIIPEHIDALLSKLREMNVKYLLEENSVTISKAENVRAANIKTAVYPGFPTDIAQPMMVLLTQANGVSMYEETIWENRMGHVKHLVNMGANIKNGNTNAVVIGPTPLYGADVEATDLRGGAAMVLAGLIAEGTTKVTSIEHILRGYDNIINKLKNVGADIKIEEY